MTNNYKLGTWNLCLGLSNKKDIVTSYLKLNNLDLCCLQETEIPNNFPENFLSTGGYNLELKLNDCKKRAGIYIRCDIKYKRRKDLEIKNHHLVIVDLLCNPIIRVIWGPVHTIRYINDIINKMCSIKHNLNVLVVNVLSRDWGYSRCLTSIVLYCIVFIHL